MFPSAENVNGLSVLRRPLTFHEPVPEWHDAAGPSVLGNHEVHVWHVSLDSMPARLASLRRILDVDEQARADKFHFQLDRDRFIVGRALMRILLGRYLDVRPHELRFSYGIKGKPALIGDFEELRFNISHSQGLALYAFTRRREIGVDVELLRPLPMAAMIAEHFFSPREAAALKALEGPAQARTFFDYWTFKEAYIKGIGKGLSVPLDQFEVSLTNGSPTGLTSERDPEVARWTLKRVGMAGDHVAAVAVEGSDWDLKCWRWQEPKALGS